MIGQVDTQDVIQRHRRGVDLAKEGVLVLPALPKELSMDLNVEEVLDRVQVQGWILAWSLNDVVKDLLSLEIIDLVVLEPHLALTLADLAHRSHDRNDLQAREEEADEGLVENLLLLGELPLQQRVRHEG